MSKTRLVVGISGASGVVYGARLVEALNAASVEVHLIISKWAREIFKQEMDDSGNWLEKQVAASYDPSNLGAAISSSSYLTDGMVVCPASVKTVSRIASADTSDLISRAADNNLKMGRRLVVCIPEKTLSPPCLKKIHKNSS